MKIIKQLGENISSNEMNFNKRCGRAISTMNFIQTLQNARSRRNVRKDLIEEALHFCEGALEQFNESDGKTIELTSVDTDRLKYLDKALMAERVLVWRQISSAGQRRKVGSQLTASAQAASKRVLDAFNKDGWQARFATEDIDSLKKFDKAVDEALHERQRL